MFYRIVCSDIRRSKLISFAILLFVTAAALLVSLAAVLIVSLARAIDTLMTQAESPHFMQMHSGLIDAARLEAFSENNGNVDEFQILEFLNLDGAQIVIDGGSLSDSVQDNGLCVQSPQFDYLLDVDGNIIHASDGELYVPLCYMKVGTAQVGNKTMVCGRAFTVAGFLRDSQMNSPLASSKRFLVSENDYNALREFGNVEYLIEFRLKDMEGLAAFEASYASAGLEANGPAITYPLFKIINAISDGIMIGVILLMSALVVAVAFMCVRFTLLAKIEDDYREIGVLKAIGLRVSDIRRLYIFKYAAIAALGAVLGFMLSFAFRGMLLKNIRLFMGESGDPALSALLGGVGAAFIFIAVIAYVFCVLKRFRRISPAKAISFGVVQENTKGGGHPRLSRSRLLGANLFIAINDILKKKKLYTTMLVVLVLSVFIMLVPLNLYHTISAKSFVSYMGIGSCDMRLDIQQADEIYKKTKDISKTMAQDEAIDKFVLLTTKKYTAITDDGSEVGVKVESGDHSVFPVIYAQGRAPKTADDIALSAMIADEMKKSVGDILTMSINGSNRLLHVCGIYSDITNGGKTAKAVFEDSSADTMGCVISAKLSANAPLEKTVSRYAADFPYAKVAGVDEYIAQTFGATTDAVGLASSVAIAAALLISVLITLLFMRMLVAKDRYAIAVLKASGFKSRDIIIQFIARAACVLIAGMILGILLANTLGQAMCGMLITSMGASSFRFDINPLAAYLLCPLVLSFVVLAATRIGVASAARIKVSESIKE